MSAHLVEEFARGFFEKNLRPIVQFAEAFPKEQIVVTLPRQLGWSHFVAILPLSDNLRRDFYAEMCRIERWSVRTLRQKMSGMLFERAALSKKPVESAKQELIKLREEDKLTPDLVFRDSYFLDFIGLPRADQKAENHEMPDALLARSKPWHRREPSLPHSLLSISPMFFWRFRTIHPV